MTRFKRWLINHYLPRWAEESLLDDNKRLAAKLSAARQQVAVLQADLQGVYRGRRTITINVQGGAADVCCGTSSARQDNH